MSTACTIRSLILAVSTGLVVTITAHAAQTGAQRCQGGQNQGGGNFVACLAKAERTFVLKDDAALHFGADQKCRAKLYKRWERAQAFGCMNDVFDVSASFFLYACQDAVAQALAGTTALGPDPMTCVEELDATSTAEQQCSNSLAACETQLDDASAKLPPCESGLTGCQADCEASIRPPLRSGQTTCFDSSGPIDCAGTGQDGEFQRGAPRSFTDNGDGTITDNTTSLMWEKLTDDGSIHDWDAEYDWQGAMSSKITTLNSTAFAGYTDWRLPNLTELESLVHLEFSSHEPVAKTFTEFDSNCTVGCSECSCTRRLLYWTSTSSTATSAWIEDFGFGTNQRVSKTQMLYVRAVRGS